MNDKSYTTTITVDKTPQQVFDAIINVGAWWSGTVEGASNKVGDQFRYRYKDIHDTTQKVTELIPGKRVVWHVTKGTLNFINDKEEWVGTNIVFDIRENNGKTEMQFTHEGISPKVECYNACSSGWESLIQGNLQRLIENGEPQPDVFA